MGHDHHYGIFLRYHSTLRDPFLHEMRVRLFRRDRYLARAKRSDSAKHKELISVAFTEQRLLENWYPHTLHAAGMDWPADMRARAEAASSGERNGSPVSRELLARFTKRQAQTVLGALLVVVVIAGAYDLRRRRKMLASR